MAPEPLLAGVYDPNRTLAPERARELVRSALCFHGEVRIVQVGPVTAGLAPATPARPESEHPELLAAFEGRIRLPDADGWADDLDVAEAWAARGDELLAASRGAFTIVLWDERRQRGLVARDHRGQRPLMWHGAGRLSFASDFRPLLGLLNPRPAPDEVAVACWAGSTAAGDGRTLYEGVRRLAPGHLLELADGRWSGRPYWVPRYREPLGGPPDELYSGVREQVDGAVARALDGVRAPGVLLSGGLDSSTVAGMAAPRARAAGTSLRAYSTVFPDIPTADESAFIDDALDSFEISGTRMAVYGGSLLAGSLAYLQAWGMPDISSNNFFWIELLRQAADHGVDALLDGEGGDELFTTPYFLIADRLAAGRVRSAVELIERFPTIAGNPSRRLRVKLFAGYGLAGLAPHSAHRAWQRLRGHPSPLELTDQASRWARAGSADRWAWMKLDGPRWWSYLARQIVYAPESIGGADHALRIGRMAGIPRRRPLLDLDLVEHVLRLPPELGFAPWYARPHMREAISGVVPDSLRLRRQKSWFSDVRVRALVQSDLAFARRMLGGAAEVRRYVRPEDIETTLAGPAPDASFNERSAWGFRLQHLAVTELWLRAQGDPDFPSRTLAAEGLAPARFRLEPQGSAVPAVSISPTGRP